MTDNGVAKKRANQTLNITQRGKGVHVGETWRPCDEVPSRQTNNPEL